MNHEQYHNKSVKMCDIKSQNSLGVQAVSSEILRDLVMEVLVGLGYYLSKHPSVVKSGLRHRRAELLAQAKGGME